MHALGDRLGLHASKGFEQGRIVSIPLRSQGRDGGHGVDFRGLQKIVVANQPQHPCAEGNGLAAWGANRCRRTIEVTFLRQQNRPYGVETGNGAQ